MRNLTESSGKALFGALSLLFSIGAHAADTLRCGSRLISTEAVATDVQKVCGEPDYIDQWNSQAGGPFNGAEEWYYNFGPGQLLRILRFQHGRLVDIQSEGYGFRDDGSRSCDPYHVTEGLSKYRLLTSCGEPASRQSGYAMRPLRNRDDLHRSRGMAYVFTEEWVYNFGAAYLVRIVTLENGRVTDVHSEGRGRDSP